MENNIPDNVINKDLYLNIKNKIIKNYPKHGAYRSMMIVKEYKKQGGKYRGDKNKTDLKRWNNE